MEHEIDKLPEDLIDKAIVLQKELVVNAEKTVLKVIFWMKFTVELFLVDRNLLIL